MLTLADTLLARDKLDHAVKCEQTSSLAFVWLHSTDMT